jgi:hypothetical protein
MVGYSGVFMLQLLLMACLLLACQIDARLFAVGSGGVAAYGTLVPLAEGSKVCSCRFAHKQWVVLISVAAACCTAGSCCLAACCRYTEAAAKSSFQFAGSFYVSSGSPTLSRHK